MTNKEKFLKLVSANADDTLKRNSERIKNRAMLRESQQIALKVLMKLDEKGWSQKDLAKALNVSPQQVSKIVSGKENLTLETQIRLQEILDLPVLATYYEKQWKDLQSQSIKFEKHFTHIVPQFIAVPLKYQESQPIQMRQHFRRQASFSIEAS